MPAYHTVTLDTGAPAQPSVETCAALTPCEWHSVRNVVVGQDSIVGGARRIVGSWGLKGSDDWPWDSSAATEDHPPLEDWRVVQPPLPTRLTPGNYLRLRVLFAPTGNTEDGDRESAAHPEGWLRVRVSWSNGAASNGPNDHELQLPAVEPDGDLPTAAGSVWGQVYELDLGEIWPADVDTDSATSEDYSEGTDVTIEIHVRGGARVIDAVVYEHPLRHTQAHDSTAAVSVHGSTAGGPPLVAMTPVPQTERRDGATYDDRRFGAHQLLRVAAQQSEVLGPKILAWTPWASDGSSFDTVNSHGDSNVEPIRITGTTALTEIVSGMTSGYDPDGPGWLVAASYAQLHRYCGDSIMISGGRAVAPVSVTVRARWVGDAGSGIVRLQSSATEWVDVEFLNGGTLESITVIGWLESQVQADQAAGVLQAFAQNTANGDRIDIFGISIDWGWPT